MEFRFTTVYDHACLTAMAKALRKTVRRKHSRRSHLFGYLLILLDILIWLSILAGRKSADFGDIVSLIVIVVVAVVLWKEDSINARVALKRALIPMQKTQTIFQESGYRSMTEAATTDWQYEGMPIAAICDVGDYVVFALNKTLAQAYDKRTLSGGSIEDFYRFIEEKTGKSVERI